MDDSSHTQRRHRRPLVRCRASGVGVRRRGLHARKHRRQPRLLRARRCGAARSELRRDALPARCGGRRARIRRRSASASTRFRRDPRHARRCRRGALDRREEAVASVIRVSLYESRVVREGQRRDIHFALDAERRADDRQLEDSFRDHRHRRGAGLNGVRRRPPPRPVRTNVRLLCWQDIGGEIAFIDWDDGTRWKADLPKFSGVVVDPAGARVSGRACGCAAPATRRSPTLTGRSSCPISSAGKYVMLASDSALAALGIARHGTRARAVGSAPGNWDVWLTFHPRSAVLPFVCPPKVVQAGNGCVVAHGEQCGRNPGRRCAGRGRDAAGDRRRRYGDATAKQQPARPATMVGSWSAAPRSSAAAHSRDQRRRDRRRVVDQWKDEVMATTLVLKPRVP